MKFYELDLHFIHFSLGQSHNFHALNILFIEMCNFALLCVFFIKYSLNWSSIDRVQCCIRVQIFCIYEISIIITCIKMKIHIYIASVSTESEQVSALHFIELHWTSIEFSLSAIPYIIQPHGFQKQNNIKIQVFNRRNKTIK